MSPTSYQTAPPRVLIIATVCIIVKPGSRVQTQQTSECDFRNKTIKTVKAGSAARAKRFRE
jgi:hypothetical protein